jgi:chromosome partitioning protein
MCILFLKNGKKSPCLGREEFFFSYGIAIDTNNGKCSPLLTDGQLQVVHRSGQTGREGAMSEKAFLPKTSDHEGTSWDVSHAERGNQRAGAKVIPLGRSRRGRYRIADLRGDFIGGDMASEQGASDGPCQTITICNHKGGAGKTATAINLSAGLAARGHRTLLIDLDPQGHSSLGLGLDTDELDHSVYDVLLNGSCPVHEVIRVVRPNLDILPSTVDLALVERELAGIESRERRLLEVMDGLKGSYRFVVIDCPPSIGVLTINALVASDLVIVPATPSSFCLYGLSQIAEVTGVLRETSFSETRMVFLLTIYDGRSKEARHWRGDLERRFGERLLKTVIRKNTKVNEAIRKGASIFEYDPRSAGAKDYGQLSREVLALASGIGREQEVAQLRRHAL